MNHFDVAIIGMGPAGSMAALLLESYGMRVLCIDKEKDIYNLNKSLYKSFSREILSATQYINNLYPDFDGEKKVFENTEKFENGKEIWMTNNKGHEFCHFENETTTKFTFWNLEPGNWMSKP